ncbi:MAG: PEP-CTERM sorting domain-containing protein [bacterium]
MDQFGSPLPALNPTLAILIYNNYVITAIDNMDVYVPGVKLTLSSFILADKSLDGPFDGPLNPPVPEPGTLLLLGGSLLGLCIGGFRRFRK